MATLTAITSVLGTSMAVRTGTKQVVAGGLLSLAAGLAWTSTASESTSYLDDRRPDGVDRLRDRPDERPGDRVDHGRGPRAKAGVGSAVNDATRILGGTLGVAVIGSVYASLYSSRLTAALPAQLPEGSPIAPSARWVPPGVAGQLQAGGQTGLSQALHDAASSAFDGFAVACLVAAGVAVLGAVFAAVLLPAQPPQTATEGGEGEPLAATAGASAGDMAPEGDPAI